MYSTEIVVKNTQITVGDEHYQQSMTIFKNYFPLQQPFRKQINDYPKLPTDPLRIIHEMKCLYDCVCRKYLNNKQFRKLNTFKSQYLPWGEMISQD